MTTTQATESPSVFDAGLPTICYEHFTNPEDAHRVIADARRQAPIAMSARTAHTC